VGSQPAADGLPSTDEVIGWGPAGGWIFQKAFVEVFVGEDTITAIEGLAKYIGKGQVTFFAADCEVRIIAPFASAAEAS
jgi:methylenetetrahydrofolate reductase (NADPH)